MTIKTELKGLKPPIKGAEKIAISCVIEKIYHGCPETNYLQACVEFADLYSYDVEDIPKLISPTLKGKIECEAIKSKLIRTQDRGEASSLDKWL